MRRIPAMVSSAGAAALTTLAVTVAVPALGDEGRPAPAPDALAVCLRAHGVDGAPADETLKDWLGQRMERDATVRRALETCAPKEEVTNGPSEQRLRSCLKARGIDIPGDDPVALKRWIAEHYDETATAAALKACDFGMDTKGPGPGCGQDGPSGEAAPGKPAEPAAKTGAVEASTGT